VTRASTDADPRPPAPQRRYPPLFAGLPVVVWMLCGLFVASMLAWSITKATYNSPDEHKHVAAALYWAEFHEWPGFKEMPMMLSVMRSHDAVSADERDAGNAASRQDRPSFADLTGEELVSGKTINQMTQHPPLYYIVLGQLHDWVPSETPADLEVWLMRGLSVLIMAPLPLLAAALARRLGGSRPVIVIAAASTALLPGLASIGGTVNNDNLLTAASSWALLGAGCVLSGDLRLRTATWIGLALAVALMSKAFAIPVALAVALAYLVTIVRTRAVRSGIIAATVAGGVAMLGGWWWVRNLLLYGTLQPAGTAAPLPDGPLPLVDALTIYLDQFVRVFFTRYWAGFDSSGSEDPALWPFLALSVVAVLVVVVALIAPTPSRPRGGALNVIVMLTPFALTLASLLYSTIRITMSTGYPAGVQGRYLYCAIIGMTTVVALSLGWLLPRRAQMIGMLVVTAGGLALTAWRSWTAVVNSWAPAAHDLMEHFRALFAWSPLPYAASMSCFLLLAGSILIVAVFTVREFRVEMGSDSEPTLRAGSDRGRSDAGAPAGSTAQLEAITAPDRS